MVLAHDITKGDRTRDVIISQNVTFETMLLAPNTLEGLKNAGFYKPSPIQLYGIPIGKCGFDLLLEAKSGTGKTAVFSIIALESLDFSKGLQVVILTPTREIAAQICDVLREIGSKYKGLKIEVVMGGLPYQEDVEKFKKNVHIVVGSPGRLRHLIHNSHINTTAVRLLVLDEADKLMEDSFHDDIKFIHTVLPKQKQVIMSSATYSDNAREFINNYMQNANHVCPDSDSILLGIEQKVTFIKYNSNIVRNTQDRFKELLKILVRIQFKQCLVFCNYQARVSEVHRMLRKEKWPSEQLYGRQEQLDRLDALKTLQQYKCRILVSTDLAARGIDASNIDLIVNFEPPSKWHTYLHRIGRAGRFGSYGIAITILNEGKEAENFKNMLKPMELPINMRHLWTDERFYIDTLYAPTDSGNLTTHKDLSSDMHEVNHENIWKMLNSTSNELNVIEPFDSLCKSQEESEIPKVEAFSDLMLSIEKQIAHGQNSEETYSYKNIKMKDSPFTKLLLKEEHVDKQKIVLECAKNTVVKELEEHRNNDKMFNIGDENRNYDMSCDLTSSEGNTIDKNVGIKNPTCSNLYSDIPSTSVSNFESSKTKSQTYQSSAKKSYSKQVNHNKHDESQPKHSNSTETRRRANNSENFDNSSLVFSKTYKTTGDDYAKKHNMSNTRQSCRNNSIIDAGSGEQLQKNHSTKSRKHGLKINEKQLLYNNWYDQLKTRMRSIEQAIYIDEMARL